jgi:imidazolonepropionase
MTPARPVPTPKPTSEVGSTSEVGCDLLIHSAAQVLTLAGGPQRGAELGRLGLIENGAVAIAGGRVLAVGPTAEVRRRHLARREIDATRRVVLPGFVDPHTHVVWMGDRAAEFELRLRGATYLEIMAAGGGIASTVRLTRQASVEDMVLAARPRLERMLAHGTTTAEAKTGYGLETRAEIRMLDAILALDEQGPIELAPTLLGAHAVPPEYAGRAQEYVEYVCADMLPRVRDHVRSASPRGPLPFVDVFCEQGAFDRAQSRQILEAARRLGFPLKIHADEFAGLGGTGLAVELGALSADHLVHTPPEDIQALGGSDTVAVALPCTPFGLAEAEYSPAAALLKANAILALASDLNPGTAWCESMQFVIALACRALKLTPAQSIAAATINAAAAIRRQDRIGSLEAGKQADLILLDAPDYRHLGYRFGTNLVSLVVKNGQVVHPVWPEG